MLSPTSPSSPKGGVAAGGGSSGGGNQNDDSESTKLSIIEVKVSDYYQIGDGRSIALAFCILLSFPLFKYFSYIQITR